MEWHTVSELGVGPLDVVELDGLAVAVDSRAEIFEGAVEGDLVL